MRAGTAHLAHRGVSLFTRTRWWVKVLTIFVLSRVMLAFLLREQADNTVRAAVFVADLVISPLLFLGAALLYFDQAARVGSAPRARRSR